MIVALSGKKGAGKSTVARYLHRRLEGSQIIAFAEPLKRIAVELFGAESIQVNGNEDQKNTVAHCGLTGRETMQRLGAALRDIWPACWIHAWKSAVESAWAEHGMVPVIVPDLRYMNELCQVLGMGGIVIRLTRDPYPADQHPSETDLDRCDLFTATIANSAMTEDEANAEALAICERMGVM
jgi:hypothetical protein